MGEGVAIAVLAGVGLLEAVLYYARINLATGRRAGWSGAITAATCALRGVWGLSVFAAAEETSGVLGVLLVYPVVAGLGTFGVQAWVRRGVGNGAWGVGSGGDGSGEPPGSRPGLAGACSAGNVPGAGGAR
jgi:hypothetical protein